MEYGFQAWRDLATPMGVAHSHSEVELNLLVTGAATYFMAGGFRALTLNRLAILWGGAPHQLVRAQRGTEFIWVTIPLRMVLEWQLPVALTERLLRGELVEEATVQPFDRPLLTRWVNDFKTRSAAARRIVLLELEARVRRLALAMKGRRAGATHSGGTVERVTRYVGEHYREELTVAQIAGGVGRHPNYVMQLFSRSTGMSLWDYVIRLRVAHAQRLLLTTDQKIVDIALEAGFGSASRFYDAFQKVCRCSPRQYRVQSRHR
ncbi:MAG: helix-turn-helix domain-containing protein [Verrucomicrobiota bacterium]